KVCRMLLEMDPEYAESYRTEIKDILRRLMIQKRIREIEQSKIFVDVEGLKNKLKKTMKESFSRYLSFLKSNVQPSTQSDVKDAIQLASLGSLDKLIKLSLPENEVTDIFQRMVVEFRDQFVSSTEHGLDGYLSVRIRHGTLEGQLRRPLEAANLITQRDSITN